MAERFGGKSPMLAVLCALPEELVELRKRMVIERAFAWQDCPLYQGRYGNRDVLLVQTGMGQVRGERAVEFLLQHYPVAALLSLGFAGALGADSKVGDIVICTTLYSGDEMTPGGSNSYHPCHSDAGLVAKAVQALQDTGQVFGQGSSVTVARPVCHPRDKSALGRAFGAGVVDMEGYWIARRAAARQVPFLSVRAISDTVEDTLPPLERFLDADGAWQRKEVVLYFLARPWQALRLVSLYRKARRARESLARFMDCFAAEHDEDD